MDRCFKFEIATIGDLDLLSEVMVLSISSLQSAYLSPEQISASFECMGIDTQLIKDGTYYLLRHVPDGQIAACGGWSMRDTLFGGDHSAGRDPRLLDPASEPARIRAMYTHPAHVRRGLGKQVLAICENSAMQAGFTTSTLAGTLAGVPLYQACGYSTVERFEYVSSTGVQVPLVKMQKNLVIKSP